jgi:hypothetical protein
LLVLSLFADADGGNCYPAERSVAEYTGMSVKTMTRAIAVATTEGWLKRTERHRGRGRGWRENRYTLMVPKGASANPLRVKEIVKGGDTESIPQGSTCGLSVPRRGDTESPDKGRAFDKGKSTHAKHGASAPTRALSIRFKSETLEAITRSAISAFNVTLAKPAGALDVVNGDIGFDVRMKQVRRVLGAAGDICRKVLGSDEITAEFWEMYFESIKTDAFLAGRAPDRRVKPAFATFMDPATLIAVFDRHCEPTTCS